MNRFARFTVMVFGVLGGFQLAVAEVPADIRKAIESSLEKSLPGMPYTGISATPIEGLYQVALEESAFLYVTGDGQHMISGDLYRNGSDGLVNLSEDARKDDRKALLGEVDLSEMIVFAAKGETKAVLNVFTDVDCGYCRKLHQEVPQLNAQGVEVRYLAFPRGGPQSGTFDRMASAWCASDPRQALTDLKAGKDIASNVCADNPVAKEFELGARMGVRGTPALVLMDGTMIPGYQPAEQLVELLGIN